ncbi:MAG: GH92 family glycosyl hydrolase [Porphyromonas sp.]|nr:GH92 family glycosyl hydrolase [Bacteroidales bacterium]MDY3101396.1 GH92 family glycosyl hydrolase [Porphyromonas sp.]
MRYKFFPIFALSLALLVGCSKSDGGAAVEKDLLRYVDPWIGSGGHGHVFVGASVPFGMVQLGPTSIPEGWDWCSGYHISDSTIIGFSHTHFSGTGIGDLLDVTVMPVVGDVPYDRGTEDDPGSGKWSYSDRTAEKVEPGYYATRLLRYNVDVELTATSRVGLHKYTFPEDQNPGIIFDLVNGGNWDDPVVGSIKKVSDTRLEGYRYSTGWAKDQRVYFSVEFSQPMTALSFASSDDVKLDGDSATTQNLFARVDFAPTAEPILVKVALSPTGTAEARANMDAEMPEWNFEAVHREASEKWKKMLRRAEIESSDTAVLRTFYTALYHTMIAPSDYSNFDGSYLGADLRKHDDPGFTTRTTFSLWDTYRAAQPLMTLIHPDVEKEVAGTLMNIYDEQGKLPVWHFFANETNTMVGNPGIPVLADAVLKGYVSDEERAFTALKNSALMPDRGQNFRKEYGYIPFDKMLESVAYDLEYALADWSVAQVARKLGKTEDYTYFMKWSESYKQYFDPQTGFMRGKSTKGAWREPFSPFRSEHRADDYCEGNAWQYTFLVPHDVKGLAGLFGSEEDFIRKLDRLFVQPTEVEGGNTSPDISGMIGQYAHGNEPGHATIYLYSMLGAQEKAAPLIRKVLTELYHDAPDGIAGNEDVGQMSAWYILSALGFYQPEPVGGRYYFGSPIVDSARLSVRDGVFEITVHGNSPENIYIQKVVLNGTELTRRYLDFEEIAQGGTLDFFMGSTPHSW